jgi:hypothetical protein
MAESETLTCYKHPGRETLLRCNKCERPICTQCAVQTPTGYRCKECVRGQQKIFENARILDFFLAVLIGASLTFVGSYIPSFLGFFTLLATPIMGTVIVEVIKWATGKRRSKALFLTATAAVILGSLPVLLMRLIPFFAGFANGNINLYGLLPLIWQAAYTILATGSVYYRLTGIRLG